VDTRTGVPKYGRTIGSKEKFLKFIEKEMSNREAWGGNQFTYFAGPARNTFRADFDKDRNGINIAAMVGFNKATSKPGLA
jgi:hypothetical protein